MSSKSKRVAVYSRVSTAEQTTETQLLAVRQYCESKGWSIGETYSDVGISGAQDSRPELDRLKIDCSKGRVDMVIVYKLDRLARSVQHLLACLEHFRSNGIAFCSVTESVDTGSPMGKMVTTFLGAIAEFERSLIQERVLAGVRRAQAEGKHCGRPRKGFDVASAIRMRSEGKSLREIADEVHVNYATVKRCLDGVAKASVSGSP